MRHTSNILKIFGGFVNKVLEACRMEECQHLLLYSLHYTS